MKMVKKLLFLLVMAAPFFMPVHSRAGDKDKNKQPDCQTSPGGNSVPLEGGVLFLAAAGLGLGAKMLYDAKAKKIPLRSRTNDQR